MELGDIPMALGLHRVAFEAVAQWELPAIRASESGGATIEAR